MKYKGYYTLKEIEKKYGKSRHTIRSWIRKGRIEAIRDVKPFMRHELYNRKKDGDNLPSHIKKPRNEARCT